MCACYPKTMFEIQARNGWSPPDHIARHSVWYIVFASLKLNVYYGSIIQLSCRWSMSQTGYLRKCKFYRRDKKLIISFLIALIKIIFNDMCEETVYRLYSIVLK